MDILIVGFGGALGCMARYAAGRMFKRKVPSSFPLGTLFVNLSGSFLLGLLLSADPGRMLLLFCAEGFLGAYTTFSTFIFEAFTMANARKFSSGAAYLMLSVTMGAAMFWAGKTVGNI